MPGITCMHAVLLPKTSRLLFWGYGPQQDQTRLWDQATGAYTQPANQPTSVTAGPEHLVGGARAPRRRGGDDSGARRHAHVRGTADHPGHRAALVRVRPRGPHVRGHRRHARRPLLSHDHHARRRAPADDVRRGQLHRRHGARFVARDVHAGRRRRELEQPEGGPLRLLLLPVGVPAAARGRLHRGPAEARTALQPGGQPDHRPPAAAGSTRSTRNAA